MHFFRGIGFLRSTDPHPSIRAVLGWKHNLTVAIFIYSVLTSYKRHIGRARYNLTAQSEDIPNIASPTSTTGSYVKIQSEPKHASTGPTVTEDFTVWIAERWHVMPRKDNGHLEYNSTCGEHEIRDWLLIFLFHFCRLLLCILVARCMNKLQCLSRLVRVIIPYLSAQESYSTVHTLSYTWTWPWHLRWRSTDLNPSDVANNRETRDGCSLQRFHES